MRAGEHESDEKIMKRWFGSLLLFLVLFASLVSCTGNGTYRTTGADKACRLFDKLCQSSLELNGDSISDSRIALTYVEINDQGVLRERAQLKLVEEVIRARGGRAPRKPQIVLMFVHGWHNNAAPNNRNVDIFRDTLESYSKTNDGIAVTGVYVGWRGTTTKFDNYLSFWSRKKVSIEVGTGALVDVVSTVERASMSTGSMMISIGHSFGGSALFNATRSLFLTRLDSPPAALADAPFPTHAAVGDLVLILNPAFETMQYWPLHGAVNSRLSARLGQVEVVGDDTVPPPPRLVIYQSQSDRATRYAFPAARLFSVPFGSHSKDSESTDSPPAVAEWKLDLYGIGHFCELNTHDVVDPEQTDEQGRYKTRGCESIEATPLISAGPVSFSKQETFAGCGKQVDPNRFKNGVWSSPSTGLSLAPRKRYKQGNPFWVVYDTVQSVKHSDINDEGLRCMIADLLTSYTKDYSDRVHK